MTCFPDKESKAKHDAKDIITRMLFVIGSVFFISMALIGVASADGTSVNWTELIVMADGIASVMPSIGTIIMSVISPMILLVFVGFFVGLFDSILGGIQNAFTFGRR